MSLNVFIPVFARFAVLAALTGGLACLSPSALRAQSWPDFGGMPKFGGMPDVGAMSYDIAMTQAWSAQGLRMTGYASSRGGVIRWINCMQSRAAPYRVCNLMVNGETGGEFPLPPNVNLRRWLDARTGMTRPYGGPGRFGSSGAMETSGQWRWGEWNAKGRFRYWR